MVDNLICVFRWEVLLSFLFHVQLCSSDILLFPVSVAKHLESANTMFSFIWWIIGFYWVSVGGQTLARDAPRLYWFVKSYLFSAVFLNFLLVLDSCYLLLHGFCLAGFV